MLLPAVVLGFLGYGVVANFVEPTCNYDHVLVNGTIVSYLSATCLASDGSQVNSTVHYEECIGFRAPTAELAGALVPSKA